MNFKLIATLSTSAFLLCGCGLATYNGWAAGGAKERAFAAEADCTQKASNGAFKSGTQWAECLVEMGQQFASSLSLNRPDILHSYETNIRHIGDEFDRRQINGSQFRESGRATFDSFWQTIQRVELARQQQINNSFIDGMGAIALSAAAVSSSAQQQPAQPSLMSVLPRSQNISQTAPPQQAPIIRSPFVEDKPSYNCTSLLTGSLIDTQCQPR